MDSSTENLRKCLERLGLEDALEFVLPAPSRPAASKDSIESKGSETILKQSPDSEADNNEQGKRPENKDEATEKNDQNDQMNAMSNEDSLLIRLLELVSEYEELANGAFRSDIIEGFSDLSRATFNSTRRFGLDSFDMRPNDASKVVKFTDDGTFELHDQLRRQSTAAPSKTQKEGARLRKSRKTLEKSAEDEKGSPLEKAEPASKDVSFGSEGKTTALSSGESPSSSFAETKPKLRDPISQFGGLVPYQLRTAQAHFSDALTHSIKLINLKCQIEELISTLNNK